MQQPCNNLKHNNKMSTVTIMTKSMTKISRNQKDSNANENNNNNKNRNGNNHKAPSKMAHQTFRIHRVRIDLREKLRVRRALILRLLKLKKNSTVHSFCKSYSRNIFLLGKCFVSLSMPSILMADNKVLVRLLHATLRPSLQFT